jgi:hypothetical protein
VCLGYEIYGTILPVGANPPTVQLVILASGTVHMSYTHEQLTTAANAVREKPPETMTPAEIDWAITHLFSIPDATPSQLRQDILDHGTMLLRSEEDFPKLEEIVNLWRGHLVATIP